MKNIITDEQKAKRLISCGYDKVYDTLSTLISNNGYNTLIMDGGKPKFSKNQNDISRLLYDDDKFKNIGIKLARLDMKSDDINEYPLLLSLSKHLYDEVQEVSYGNNLSLPWVIDQLKKELNKIKTQYIKRTTIPDIEYFIDVLKSKEDINSDIIDLIMMAINDVGSDGVINIDDSNTEESVMEVIPGMSIDRGVYKDLMMDPLQSNMIYENPYIFITDYKIKEVREIDLLYYHIKKNRNSPLILIADDFDNELIKGTQYLKNKYNITTVLIKAPAYGDRKVELLDDLAAYTGATYISSLFGYYLNSSTGKSLGLADRVIVNKNQTRFINGHYDRAIYNKRIEMIRGKLANDDSLSEFDYENDLKRLARLKARIATIKIGAYTDTEREYKKERAESLLRYLLSIMRNGSCKDIHIIIRDLMNTYNDPHQQWLDDALGKAIYGALYKTNKPFNDKILNFTQLYSPIELVYSLFDKAFSSVISRLSIAGIVRHDKIKRKK